MKIARAFFLLIILFFIINNISALCEEGQIDINIASLEDLEQIVHVGPKVASYIIERRPFNSLDDLVRVPYISEGYVEDIKSQGLACVTEEYEKSKEETQEKSIEENHESTSSESILSDTEKISKISEEKESEIIYLNPKVIKSEKINENLDKTENKNYAFYEFVAFCILLGVLFLMRKGKQKTEFD